MTTAMVPHGSVKDPSGRVVVGYREVVAPRWQLRLVHDGDAEALVHEACAQFAASTHVLRAMRERRRQARLSAAAVRVRVRARVRVFGVSE
jgi:hypothetical protein